MAKVRLRLPAWKFVLRLGFSGLKADLEVRAKVVPEPTLRQLYLEAYREIRGGPRTGTKLPKPPAMRRTKSGA